MIASFCGANEHDLEICEKVVRSIELLFPEIKAWLELTLKLTTVTYHNVHL